MGTSWNKRHRHEEPARRAADRKAYLAWKSALSTEDGKWCERKIQAWMQERLARYNWRWLNE